MVSCRHSNLWTFLPADKMEIVNPWNLYPVEMSTSTIYHIHALTFERKFGYRLYCIFKDYKYKFLFVKLHILENVKYAYIK